MLKQIVGGLILLATLTAGVGAEERELSVSIETPHPGYKMQFIRVYQVGEELWAIAQVKLPNPDGVFATVIDRIEAKVKVDADPDLTVHYFVMGKDWNWGDDTDSLTYVSDNKALDKKLSGKPAKLLWEQEKRKKE